MCTVCWRLLCAHPGTKQRLSVLSRSVGIPSLLVSGIQNGTEPPPLLFYHLFSCVRFSFIPAHAAPPIRAHAVTRTGRPALRSSDTAYGNSNI